MRGGQEIGAPGEEEGFEEDDDEDEEPEAVGRGVVR